MQQIKVTIILGDEKFYRTGKSTELKKSLVSVLFKGAKKALVKKEIER